MNVFPIYYLTIHYLTKQEVDDLEVRKIMIATLYWIAVLLWLIFIYILSDQPAAQSSELSKKITEVIVKTVERLVPQNYGEDSNINLVEQFHHLVRKNAHFFIYLVLGILTIGAIRWSGVLGLKAFVLTLSICVLYAVSDEIHQLYVPGRSAEVMDVFIDSAGAIVGIGMYRGIASLLDKRLCRG